MYSDCGWAKMIPDKYSVLAQLGRGGFGSVYKVKDEHIDKLYAMKIVKYNALGDADKEINILKSLDFQGLPALHDVFYDEEYMYIVMELARGSNLETYVKSKGKLSVEETYRIGYQICDILKYLHGRPIPVIHGDIKPENIIVSDESVSLVDFGCAFLQYSEEYKYMGTPEYAAPELLRGEALTESDVYSFGKVLIFMLTGRQIGIVNGIKVQDCLAAYAVPKRLCKLVVRCLEEDIKRRFRSGLELSKEMKGITTRGTGFVDRWIVCVVSCLRWSGTFLTLYSLFLYQRQLECKFWFFVGMVLLTMAFIIGARVDKYYKSTILECECNILVSEGL
ncbi:MAG: serine/threonine protein kinase [Lachnospiraceae bacterium]|nr:serine/threonine protein kinase [Lachnospiraceae bacterium]